MAVTTKPDWTGFAKAVLDEYYEWDLGDIDGGWLQETAVKFGVVEMIQVAEPCGVDGTCRCEDCGDFPTTCYRRVDQ